MAGLRWILLAVREWLPVACLRTRNDLQWATQGPMAWTKPGRFAPLTAHQAGKEVG